MSELYTVPDLAQFLLERAALSKSKEDWLNHARASEMLKTQQKRIGELEVENKRLQSVLDHRQTDIDQREQRIAIEADAQADRQVEIEALRAHLSPPETCLVPYGNDTVPESHRESFYKQWTPKKINDLLLSETCKAIQLNIIGELVSPDPDHDYGEDGDDQYTTKLTDRVHAFVTSLKEQLAAAQKDQARYRWALPILTGVDDPATYKRSMCLRAALLLGMDGDDAIHRAMKESS